MARITLWFLPASWYCGVAPRQKLLLLLLLAASVLLLLGTHQRLLRATRRPHGTHFSKYLSSAESMEATDVRDAGLNYGVVVDCGSSGSRVFVYYWPPHNGNPHTLLDIRQMRDLDRQPVVKKIKPGISSLATSPTSASDYLYPLLGFAAAHVPQNKHKETPLYILCTAGMRLLPESQQVAILDDLVSDVPLDFDFLFSRSHAEVISGKQEGVYAWIGINFVLGRFDHADDEDSTVEVTAGSQHQRPISRRRTVGIMDMGGASLQIAYEVPGAITFSSPQEEEAGKSVLAEFNLGCDVEHTQHVYRVYVTTFLGFGGNMARQRYEQRVLNTTLENNRLLNAATGLSEDKPYLDPCLPLALPHTLVRDNRTVHLRGQGDWARCLDAVQPFLGLHNGTMTAGGIYQAPINFSNSEFYGFSEFYYCMEDVLRIGGEYDSDKYSKAATEFCATRWPTLKQRLDKKLFSQQADIDRLKYQCFKSAWMFQVLHAGFRFPSDYRGLRTAQLVYDKEVQWTLGAILYKTRFLPLRDLQQEALRQSHPNWLRSSFVYNHHLFSLCLLVVVLAILLYILRLRRIHQREQRQADTLDMLWDEEGEALIP
ncbi:ectonucleoside triphosphate diphosphohydrolase 7-like [Hippocampus comes]|uniref:nucleoside-triphosphate phosphatase n=1 Tax=Hippocampus comes TaxID=109280 RepID=A0A3Q2XQ08_HIPCM|nr:PREDICTED: ectonucleoside triphosphate diphosphohydrolase 7-like [Hippocampus comes]XP_019717532.1 PREDICTED: ectonucleoside triphosphate diphosphohydrolase 7-like [Hippocampus comes]